MSTTAFAATVALVVAAVVTVADVVAAVTATVAAVPDTVIPDSTRADEPLCTNPCDAFSAALVNAQITTPMGAAL